MSDAKATVYKAVDYCHILRDDGLAYDLKGEALDGKEETA